MKKNKKRIMRSVAVLRAKYRGIEESVHYEDLAERIVSDYFHIADKSILEERQKLGVRVLAVFDDHGYIGEDELEEAIGARPDFVVYGGDHSPYTVEKIAEAAVGVPKYALLGNHDGAFVEKAFRKVGAVNIHGRILITDQGLTIGGMHGSHIYKDDRSGKALLYQDESMMTAVKMIDQMHRQSTGLDILFAHDQAFIRAYDPALPYNDGCSHCGLIGNTFLAAYHDIYAGVRPAQYFVHGHLHLEYQKTWENGQIEKCVYGVRTLEL